MAKFASAQDAVDESGMCDFTSPAGTQSVLYRIQRAVGTHNADQVTINGVVYPITQPGADVIVSFPCPPSAAVRIRVASFEGGDELIATFRYNP